MKVFLYIRVACADQLAAADQREELERYAKDKSSVYRARNHCGCIRSGWCRLRSELESLTVFSSAFTRTMLPVGWTMSALP